MIQAAGRLALTLLAGAGLVQAQADPDPADTPPTPLTRPEVGQDPRWLQRLPPVVLPLPKPGTASSSASPASAIPVSTLDAPPAAAPSPVPAPPDPEVAAPPDTTPAPVEIAAPPDTMPVPVEIAAPPDTMPVVHETAPPEPELAEPIADEEAAMTEVLETLVVNADNPDAGDERRNAPAPAERPAAAPDPVSPYRWHVQLLAGRSLDLVKLDRDLFVRRYRALLEGLTLTISQSRYGDARDAFYRLRAIEWTSRRDAVQWCRTLRARGHDCLVTRITPRPD